MSVRKTSFSTCSWAATAAAAVSALTLSQRPPSSAAIDGMTGTTPPGPRRRAAGGPRASRGRRGRGRWAGRPAPGSVSCSPNRHCKRAGRTAPTARPPRTRICSTSRVGLLRQDADDDFQRGVVGDAAALDLARLQAGRRHRAVDGLAAAVDEDRAQADRLHENHVLQRGLAGRRGLPSRCRPA